MDVEMGHLLVAVRPGIGEQATARRDQPRRARDLADGADEAGNLLVGRSCGEIVPRHIGAPGDHEDVGTRLRARTSVEWGTGWSDSVDLGGRRILKKNNKET